ncbi:UNVERIFIED_CONTAM: hypothetical protein K2H54_015738 [Gekko kuhli]
MGIHKKLVSKIQTKEEIHLEDKAGIGDLQQSEYDAASGRSRPGYLDSESFCYTFGTRSVGEHEHKSRVDMGAAGWCRHTGSNALK